MKRNFRGLGLYVVIFLIIILGWYSFASRGIGTNTCTQAEFEQALEDDKINSIVIKQNEEVPTGTVTILLKDGTRELMNVSDVGVIQETLKEADFDNYTLKDVPGEKLDSTDFTDPADGRYSHFLYHEYECAGRRRR